VVRAFTLALASSLLLGCGAGSAGDENVVEVASDSPEMNRAMERARATSGELLRRIQSPPASQATVTVKIPLRSGEDVEHIWVDQLTVSGGRIHGRLANQPVDGGGRSLGDTVSVAPGEISDWMAIDGGRLCGGYTVLVHRDGMSAAERDQMDQNLGLIAPPRADGTC
jgi:uncharacterized protein YegJ (DUF2314 family)